MISTLCLSSPLLNIIPLEQLSSVTESQKKSTKTLRAPTATQLSPPLTRIEHRSLTPAKVQAIIFSVENIHGLLFLLGN